MTAQIVPLHAPPEARPRREPYSDFTHYRRQMALALQAWIEAGATPADVAAEVDGTVNQLRAIRDLGGHRS